MTRLSYLPRALRLVWKAAKNWTLAWFILLVIQGLLPAATVYLTRLLVDSLVAAMGIGGSWESVQQVLVPATLMAVVMLLTELLQGASEWISSAQSELIQDYISALVHGKSTTVDLAFYESPEDHDRLHRAREDASSRPLELLENIGSLLQNSITLLAMATVLIPYGAWLPMILLVSTLPAFYVVFRFNRRYHLWWQQTTPDRRWTDYYDFMLTYDEVAAELRLFGLGSHFQSAYQALRRRLRTKHLRLIKEQSLARLGAGATALLISGVAMAWMVWQTFQGLATLGDLALFYQAFNQGQSLMRSLLGNVSQIYTNSLFLANLFEFLDLEPQVVDVPNPIAAPSALKEGIRFRQVTFSYPGSERIALQNLNLTIPAGQTVAIVGDNGAGKSTLVKLLCRFYDPEAGAIELDGIDIRNLSLIELRRLIAVLFQLPVNYHATAAENIALGDLSAVPSMAEIEAAARGAGAHEVIARLPQEYDTLLGKWFIDGTDLSGGEWQRIALARAFLRQAQIVVLDEPTSAMDSWAEAKWLERLQKLVRDRTAIIITHRFTTAMRADVIHVMRNGQIVESGSHKELLARGGFYAQSWTAQTQASES
jgi:ATP-binding cassette subfamily B protein